MTATEHLFWDLERASQRQNQDPERRLVSSGTWNARPNGRTRTQNEESGNG
jgi:hypothetical protein